VFSSPPPAAFSLDWEHANIPTSGRDTSKGTVSAMLKRVANGRTMDLSLRSGPMHALSCPGDDDGRHECALTCTGIHLNRLRAFSITGEKYAASSTLDSFQSPECHLVRIALCTVSSTPQTRLRHRSHRHR